MTTQAPAPTGSIDFGRCFSFLTEDPEWVKKVLIGGAFVLLAPLLVGIPFLLGYWARTVKRVAAGEARPLPEWEDFGGLFNEGLPLVAVYLAYTVGLFLAIGAVACVLALPFMAIGGAGAHGRGPEAMLAALGGLGMLAFYLLLFVASLALAVYLPSALVRTAWRGRIADGFEWRRNIDLIRANLGNYLLSFVVYLVASFLAQFGVLLCCVGVFPASFWSFMVLAYALGETLRLNPRSI